VILVLCAFGLIRQKNLSKLVLAHLHCLIANATSHAYITSVSITEMYVFCAEDFEQDKYQVVMSSRGVGTAWRNY